MIITAWYSCNKKYFLIRFHEKLHAKDTSETPQYQSLHPLERPLVYIQPHRDRGKRTYLAN